MSAGTREEIPRIPSHTTDFELVVKRGVGRNFSIHGAFVELGVLRVRPKRTELTTYPIMH